MADADSGAAPWYTGVTRYQWLVLLIACLGWIFDAFEGQIFVASMNEAMPSLLPADAYASAAARETAVHFYNNVALGMFLLGGALGGVMFGVLSDRIGRTKAMILTILMYSCFTGATAFVQTWWQMALLRFLVAMGVGGEWAVASAMVAEVFPMRARAYSLGIFHSSSVCGIYLAVLAGFLVVANPRLGWRWGFALGTLPALLTLWVRYQLREPEQWIKARETARIDRAKRTGSVADLFTRSLLRNTLVGTTLATVGLGTYWGVHIYGKDLYRQKAKQYYAALSADATEGSAADATSEGQATAVKHAEMLGMLLVNIGALPGLLAFGPISERTGRRRAFLVYLSGALLSTWALFQGFSAAPIEALWIALPIFGFLTGGFHAGFAIYFPELFPTRLRGTGSGFCFNGGRLAAAPILVLVAWLRGQQEMSLENCVSLLGILFAVGIVALMFARETKGHDLPA